MLSCCVNSDLLVDHGPGGRKLDGEVIMTRCRVALTGIHLWIMGQADVSWAERPGTRHSHYEYEIYMKDCFILWGKGGSDSVVCRRRRVDSCKIQSIYANVNAVVSK